MSPVFLFLFIGSCFVIFNLYMFCVCVCFFSCFCFRVFLGGFHE